MNSGERRKADKERVRTALASFDSQFREAGFQRPPRSFSYKRKCVEFVQKIDFSPDFAIPEAPDSRFAIYPTAMIESKELFQSLCTILADDNPFGYSAVIFNSPVAHLRSPPTGGKFYQSPGRSASELVDDAVSFALQGGVSALDQLKTKEDYVSNYFSTMDRFVNLKWHTPFVGAAMAANGRKADAAALLVETFSSDVDMRRHSKLIQAFRALEK